jgi:hypothetical protein
MPIQPGKLRLYQDIAITKNTPRQPAREYFGFDLWFEPGWVDHCEQI